MLCNIFKRLSKMSKQKQLTTFNVLDPVGAVVEEWELKGAFIQSANFGDLAFDSSDPVEINMTLRYDYAVLKF